MTSIKSILIRYGLLIAFGALFFLGLLYKALLPITIYPSHFFLNLFYNAMTIDNFIILEDVIIEIIPACVGVSAYFLLAALTLSTPLSLKKTLKTFLFLFLIFSAVNILRIVSLSALYIRGSVAFNIVHSASWYLLSIVLVVGAWFLAVAVLRIKEIPAYSDIQFLLRKRRQ